jgi:FdhE protein
VRSAQFDIAELTAAVLAGQPQSVHERAESLGLDVPLTASVLSLTLFSVLAPIRAGLEPLLTAGSWTEGYCPVCGSFPKLGEFRGLEQTRFLRCGLCAAEWQFPRLRCPCCGNRNHRQLGYLHVEGEEGKCRSGTCEECRQYIKMVSTLTPLSPLQLLVTDVATVHLDLLAADRGFSPPM